jgi:hypothetical protein
MTVLRSAIVRHHNPHFLEPVVLACEQASQDVG